MWIPFQQGNDIPEGEVLAINLENEMLIGYIGNRATLSDNVAVCSDGYHELENVVAYIPAYKLVADYKSCCKLQPKY